MPQAIKKKPKEPDLLVLAMRKAHAQVHGTLARKPAKEGAPVRNEPTGKIQSEDQA